MGSADVADLSSAVYIVALAHTMATSAGSSLLWGGEEVKAIPACETPQGIFKNDCPPIKWETNRKHTLYILRF